MPGMAAAFAWLSTLKSRTLSGRAVRYGDRVATGCPIMTSVRTARLG